MPAARYWRAVGISTHGGGDLELSALHLYFGAGDSEYNSVSLLLDGGSLVDKSITPKTVTAFAGAAVSSAQSKFGGSSFYFDGVDDYLTVGSPADWAHLHNGDTFTVEAWVYRTGGSSPIIVATCVTGVQTGMYLGISAATGLMQCSMYAGNGSNLTWVSTQVVPANQWVHVAFTHLSSGKVGTFFLNGVLSGQGAPTYDGSWPGNSTANPAYTLSLGKFQHPSAQGYFQGYVDELRITRGVVRYTANFAPPASAFANSVVETGRADQLATLSCTVPALSGAVSNLQDEDLFTVARFDANQPGFALQWDFGVAGETDVVLAVPGSSSLKDEFVSALTLQYSTTGASWVTYSNLGHFVWPGANTLSTVTGVFQIKALTSPDPIILSGGSVGDTVAAFAAEPLALDLEDGGAYRVVGTTKEVALPTNTPLSRRVRLHNERDGRLVREVWSDAQGNYIFDEIKGDRQYSVIAYDHTGTYRAVIADNITPTPL